MAKITDPKQKYEFEKKHPEVLNRFGLYSDPRLYTENQAAFYKMNQASAVRDQQRLAALALAKKRPGTPRRSWTHTRRPARRSLR